MKKVALITDIEFWKGHMGNSLRILTLIEELKRNVDLEVIFLGKIYNKEKVENKLEIRVHEIKDYKQYIFNRLKQIINNFPKLRQSLKGKMRTKMLSSYYNEEKKNRVKKILEDGKYTSVIVEYIWLNYLVEEYKGNKIIDTHDIQSDRVKSYKEKGMNCGFEISLQEEVEVLKKYNLILTINDRDNEILSSNGIEKNKIITLPLKMECKKIIAKKSNKIKLGFIAAPIDFNIDAIHNFLVNIFPILEQSFLIELHIYGGICSSIKDRKNVYKHGFIKNINEAYENIDICINPIRVGGGLKIKNIEALSKGKILLTSIVGAQGLEDGIGNAFFVTENIEDWKQRIRQVNSDLKFKEQIENKAIEYIRKKFDTQIEYSKFLEQIN